MTVFEKVTFGWEGKDYTLQPEGMLRVICEVESVITLAELSRHALAGTWPTGRLASAYAIMLRAAGAPVTDEDVFVSLFEGGEMQKRAMEAIHSLQVLMIPPAVLRKRLAEAEAKKAPVAGAATASSSPSSTS